MAHGYNRRMRRFGPRTVGHGLTTSPGRPNKPDVAVSAKRKFVEMLKNVPCKDCGQIFAACCMDFDHRDGTDKKFGVAQGINSRSIQELIDEINKCDIVCSNCHRVRTIKRARGIL